VPARVMRLTAEHVAKVHRDIPDPGRPPMAANLTWTTEADHAETVAKMLATRPPGGFWLFAYGSLIWKPETAFVERRLALARGWRRRFCLGWDRHFRGSKDAPGLMMALDRGGQCRAVVYRLPEEALEAELLKLSRREHPFLPPSMPWRWIDVETEQGPVRALGYAVDRKAGGYVGGVSDDELANMLATACGFRGSMAEYLRSTVSHLEELGIHDGHLWRLQEMAAARIEAERMRDR
jgi:cation transport protein ChaC